MLDLVEKPSFNGWLIIGSIFLETLEELETEGSDVCPVPHGWFFPVFNRKRSFPPPIPSQKYLNYLALIDF